LQRSLAPPSTLYARSTYSTELVQAGQRAYDRWLADFCGTHPDRMGGLALVQFADVDAAMGARLATAFRATAAI
jgi:hypothetical protein